MAVHHSDSLQLPPRLTCGLPVQDINPLKMSIPQLQHLPLHIPIVVALLQSVTWCLNLPAHILWWIIFIMLRCLFREEYPLQILWDWSYSSWLDLFFYSYRIFSSSLLTSLPDYVHSLYVFHLIAFYLFNIRSIG